MRTSAHFWSGLSLAAGLLGCSEEKVKQVQAEPPDPLADVPADLAPTLTEGHWGKDQRGIAIDAEDFAVIQREESPAGISIKRLTDGFSYLVLNLQYLDYLRGGAGSNPCVDVDNAEDARPLATAKAFIERLSEQKGLSFSGIIVNVDLLDPTRKRPLYVCGDDPIYGSLDYRASLIEAFVELSELPGLRYVTVGTELNKYSYFRNAENEPVPEDYVNLITLYREIYGAVHEARPDVKIGPGFSWDFFMNVSVPAVASEFTIADPEETGLSVTLDPTSVGAFYRTWLRTIQPFLLEPGEPNQFAKGLSADFVGFTIAPDIEVDPWVGEPTPADEGRAAAVEKYYRYLALAAALKLGDDGPLPIAFPQMDWPIKSSGFGRQKGPFLETFKRAVSHVDVAFVAWRRLADLPTQVQNQTPPCDRVMDAYGFEKEFCNSGLITSTGEVRDTLDILTTDP